MVGVAVADNTRSTILVAGIAGLTAGTLSMAAGEYEPVSSQLDTERADLAREERELAAAPEAELDELAGTLRRDRLAVHDRDELVSTSTGAPDPCRPRPSQHCPSSVAPSCPSSSSSSHRRRRG